MNDNPTSGLTFPSTDAEFLSVLGVFTIGFLTIASQLLLLREIFSVLDGSDLAIAFALASWTVLSALGAWIARSGPCPTEPVLRLLPLIYVILTSGVAAWLRCRAADGICPFSLYLHIPLWLTVPCLAGGCMFTWYVRFNQSRDEAFPTATLYSFETAGGLLAGLGCGLYFYLQGGSTAAFPALAALALLSFRGAGNTGSRIGRWILAIVLLVPSVIRPFGNTLDRIGYRLSFPGERILEHRNTAYVPLTAVESARGDIALFENGRPLPVTEPTPSQQTAVALLATLPVSWGEMLLINPENGGLRMAADHFANCRLTAVEPDQAKRQFFQHWISRQSDTPCMTVTSLRQTDPATRFDLIVIASPLPGSLQVNRYLTKEFFDRCRERLDTGGVMAVLLPAPPGFIHPGQERTVESIDAAMAKCFSHTCRIQTDLGWQLLAGSPDLDPSDRPLDSLAARCRNLPADIPIEVENIRALQEIRKLGDLSRISPESAPKRVVANSISNPNAYFSHILFQSTMIEGALPGYAVFLDQKPLRYGLILLGGLFLAAGGICTGKPGFRRLFWASWQDTVAVIFSIYVYQAVVGQAYWATSFFVAANLLGIFVAAGGILRLSKRFCMPALAYVPCLIAFSVFCPDVQNNGILLILCMTGCVWTGMLAGYSFVSAEQADADGGALFAVDLIGSAGGFLIGGGILMFWHGATDAAILATSVAILGMIGKWNRTT